MLKSAKDWDDAFANMAHVAGSDALPSLWAAQAEAYRASSPNVEQDIAYGDHPREVLDLVWPEKQPKGLLVFIHGGFWMRLDKSFWTPFAEGARAQGWAVCLPSYTLAPDARISHITQQIGAAISLAASLVAGGIRVAGHSAGGHLATRMICDDTPLSRSALDRMEHTMAISGLHDLRPLRQTKMNEVLNLDKAEARRESPVLRHPATARKLTCWVGGGERPEFIRQSKLLAQIWSGLDIETECLVDGQHNHFTIIEGLRDPSSAITRALVSSK